MASRKIRGTRGGFAGHEDFVSVLEESEILVSIAVLVF